MQTWNNKQAFGWVSVALHWIAAIGVLAMIWTGLNGGWAEDAGDKAQHRAYMALHVSIGGTLIVFALARVLAHYAQTRPDLPSGEARPLRAVARISHNVLLIAIIVQFVSGPLMIWTGGKPGAPASAIHIWNSIVLPSPFGSPNRSMHEFAEMLHMIGRWTLFIVIPIHVLAALKHEFFDRDGVLMQMLVPGRALRKP
jgi:cytochrome b561